MSNRTTGAWADVRVFLEMIKISHTLFALPFALGASFLAAGGWPDAIVLGKIVLAVFFARTAAMAFNRWLDRDVDAKNPRTTSRALPAGALHPTFVLLTAIVCSAAFVGVAAWINRLALELSPVALLFVLGYSATKRFTALCHVVLGASLAIAPMGAWVAVTGELPLTPWLLGGAVLLWTAGFDILYACMDAEFDRGAGLYSIPVRLGIPGALRLASVLHVAMVGTLVTLTVTAELGWMFALAVAIVAAMLIYEHRLVRPDDLSRVNRAFFTMNGLISALLMVAMILTATIARNGISG